MAIATTWAPPLFRSVTSVVLQNDKKEFESRRIFLLQQRREKNTIGNTIFPMAILLGNMAKETVANRPEPTSQPWGQNESVSRRGYDIEALNKSNGARKLAKIAN